jgi:hypothetical protein
MKASNQLSINASALIMLPPIVLLASSLLLYFLACVLPAVNLDLYSEKMEYVSTSSYPGFLMLLFGYLGVFQWEFAWFANPLLLSAWLMIIGRFWKLAIITSLIAFVFALNTFTFKEAFGSSFFDAVYIFKGLDIGGVFWFGSIVCAVLAASVGYLGSLGPWDRHR